MNRRSIAVRQLAAAALAATAGCAGTNPASPALPSSTVMHDGTGVKRQGIAVADYGNNDVVVFDSAYGIVRTITAGINGPVADVYDRQRRLYVVNGGANNVTEYTAKGKLVFTYSYGTTSARAVAVNAQGNVFVAASNGAVTEFLQQVASPIAECTAGIAAYGIAVDPAGDVFVDGGQYNTAQLVEYPGGLAASGCQSTTLGVRTNDGNLGAIALDKENDLVISDPPNHVLIVAPPYSSVTSTLNFLLNTSVAVNKNNAVMFVAEPAAGQVSVNQYPSGNQITTLGSSAGLSQPEGVATFAYYK